jgi:hypothetical protein
MSNGQNSDVFPFTTELYVNSCYDNQLNKSRAAFTSTTTLRRPCGYTNAPIAVY